ncbi:MAG: protein kinase [Acidimicrobiia bacterium]|nr:protein kinase [Acidimicrobiia bacterium]
MALDQEAVVAALPLYEVEGELGHGAWGVVLAGRHRQLGRDVAIKQLPRSFGADPAVRSRFIAEARLLASLDHPHVVPLYDFVEHDGLCLLVMERLTGGTLWSRARSGAVTAPNACALVLAALSALQYAHQRGVLHRDVKPENLMFSGKGDLKVTDFGIAKVVGGAATVATRAGDVLGTPAYMAPEQAMGQELSPPTDVYAVGTVLYELLSGTLPFPEDSNPVSTLYRHVHEDPKPLLDVNPQVPWKLAEVTQQSLAREPRDRFHDAEAFAVALAEAACQSWGPGWLPASGMTVSTSGPVLSAATGQTPRLSPETLVVRHDTPRETPALHEVAPPELVSVNDLLRDSAPAETGPGAPAETQVAASAEPPQPPQPPWRAGSSPGGPPTPPPAAPAPAGRRRPWLIAVPVVLVVIVAVVVALLVSGGGSSKTVATQEAALTPGQWAAEQSSPTPRQELASAVSGGVVWVLGGLNGEQATAKVEGFDPVANAWRPGPDLPLPLHHEVAATYKGEVIVAGGWIPQNGVLNAQVSDQAFVLRGGKWVTLPHLRHARAAAAAAVVGNKLVVFGGQAEGKLVPQTEVWDGTSWSDGPDLPTLRDHLAGASDGTYAYAVGGRMLSADKNVGAVERYDPSANKWSKLPDLPTPRGDLGAAFVGTQLVTVGGESSTGVFSTVESYDTKTGRWSSGPAMRTPRHGLTVATVGKSLYALDGAVVPSHGVATTVAEVLPFSAGPPGAAAAGANPPSSWQTLSAAPTALQEVASTVQGSVVWVLGGLDGSLTPSNAVYGYDTTIDSWTAGPPLPVALHGALATTYHGDVVVLGGWTMGGGGGASNQVFALRGGAWVPLPSMPTPHAAGGAVVVGDKVVVVGGQANGQDVSETDVFDGTTWTQAAPLPTPRDYVAVVTDGTFVYAIGGQQLDVNHDVGAVERFDPSTGKWTKLAPLPTARHGLGAAVVNGRLYAIGGETGSTVLGEVESLDLANGSSWDTGTSMRTARHALAVQAVGPAIYAIEGGSAPGGSRPTDLNEVLRP